MWKMSFCDSDQKSMLIVGFLTCNDSVMSWGSKLVYLGGSHIGPLSHLQCGTEISHLDLWNSWYIWSPSCHHELRLDRHVTWIFYSHVSQKPICLWQVSCICLWMGVRMSWSLLGLLAQVWCWEGWYAQATCGFQEGGWSWGWWVASR